MRLTEGDLIGHYKVVSTIGAGAMGAVYRVFDTRLEVERALKIIKLPELADDDELAEYRTRFYREARTIANLHVPIAHPNIIQVHDMGELGGLPWFTMNSFPGMSLTEWMGLKPRPTPDQALKVMKQLTSGLAHAHKRGVKHRDIKLGNALVTPDGEHAVLIDWGIAKADNDKNLTMTGAMSGTEAYMAPEYLMAGYRGEPSSHTEQTDLWSLGVVFYALATGKRAFDASVEGYQKRIIEAEFKHPVQIRSDLDDDFVAVILDLLKKDPTARIQSADALLTRLNALKRTIDPAKPAFDSQSVTIPASGLIVQAAPAVKVVVPDMGASKAGQPTPDPTVNGRSKAVEIDPFRAAMPAKPLASSDGIPLPPEPAGDDLWGTARPPVRPAAAAAAPATQPAPAKPAGGAASDGQTFLRAMLNNNADDERSVVGARAPAEATGAGSRAAAPTSLTASTSSTAPPVAPAAANEESVVRPVSFGEGAVALRAERGKIEARRALVLAVGAVGALVVTGFTVTSMFGGDSGGPPPQSTYVDPATLQQQRDAKAALAEIEREKAEQEEQARRVALALEERQRAQAAAAAAQPPPDAAPPPDAPVPVASKPTTVIVKRDQPSAAAAPATAQPPAAEVSRYGNRQSGNTASVGTQTTATTAAATTAAVQGVRIPARLKVQATSAPGPIIAVVTQETLVGSVRIPAGTEVHGQPSGANGTRLNISFSTALIGGKNVGLRGIALGADQRAGLNGSRTLGNGTDTAADVAGTVVGNAGSAIANAAGLKPVADAVNAATGSAQDKTRRINSAEDIVVVPSSTRFFIYVEGI